MKKFTNAELLELDLNKTEKNKHNKNFTEQEKEQGYKSVTEDIPGYEGGNENQTENESVTNLVSGK